MSLHDVFEDIGHNVRRRITTSSRAVATRTLRALVHGTYANDGGTHVI